MSSHVTSRQGVAKQSRDTHSGEKTRALKINQSCVRKKKEVPFVRLEKTSAKLLNPCLRNVARNTLGYGKREQGLIGKPKMGYSASPHLRSTDTLLMRKTLPTKGSRYRATAATPTVTPTNSVRIYTHKNNNICTIEQSVQTKTLKEPWEKQMFSWMTTFIGKEGQWTPSHLVKYPPGYQKLKYHHCSQKKIFCQVLLSS